MGLLYLYNKTNVNFIFRDVAIRYATLYLMLHAKILLTTVYIFGTINCDVLTTNCGDN